jgi:hypothetical protein
MPTPSKYYLDLALTGVAAGYAPGGLIATQVFPLVPAAKQSGKFWNIDSERRFLKILDTARGPGAEANRMGYNDPGTLSFFAMDHALTGFLPDEVKDQAEVEAQEAIPTVEDLVRLIALEREQNLVTLLGTLSQTSSPSTKWDDPGGSAISDLKAQKETIRTAVGRSPNTIAITDQVLDLISETPDWKERVYQGGFTATEVERIGPAALLASFVGVEKIFVATAYHNTAALGQPASMASIWGENVLLAYTENPRGLNRPSQALGIHVAWSGGEGKAMDGFLVERSRFEERKSDAFHVHHYYDQVLLNAGAGYLFTNVLT